MEHSIIINEHVRLTLLSKSLVRMEYSSNGCFEDNVSVRLIKQDKSLPFNEIKKINNCTEVSTDLFNIVYKHDKLPFNEDNLKVIDKNDHLIWKPGKIDKENLGGVHLAMDCIQRKVIPSGVHPATTEYHDNSTTFHLWSYLYGNKDQVDPDVHYDDENLSLEQLISLKDFNDLTPHIQKLLLERKKYPPGILSNNGYFLYNDSNMPVYKNNWPKKRNSNEQDYYLFIYNDDFEKGLMDYMTLFGKTPMIPRYSLGLWFSRYPTFSQKETSTIIDKFDENNLPIDVLVLDLEWHKRGWYGFDWDLDHYPSPKKFITNLKEKSIYTTLNVHPDGIPIEDSMFNEFISKAKLSPSIDELKEEIYSNIDLSRIETAKAFMEVLHKPNYDNNIDFWWIDGSAHCNLDKLGKQFQTNEIYMTYMKEKYPDKRALICSRTEGLGSHRYPFHFTGDTYSQYEVLNSQVEYTLRAGHIGQSFITHDIGGHMCKYKHIDSELLCRWYQFGAMSPIFRLHSSGGSERVPWLYDEFVSQSLKSAMKFRMELLPYLYSLVYESHAKCIPMLRSNPLSDINWKEGHAIWDAYYLGRSIYCTPITNPGDYRYITLPEGKWYSGFNNLVIDSNGKDKNFIVNNTSNLPPHFYKAGRLITKQLYNKRASIIPEKIVIELYLDDIEINDSFTLYEDDGISNDYKDGIYSKTNITVKGKDSLLFKIKHDDNKDKVIPINRTYDLNIYTSKKCKVICNNLNLQEKKENYYCYIYNEIATDEEIEITVS